MRGAHFFAYFTNVTLLIQQDQVLDDGYLVGVLQICVEPFPWVFDSVGLGPVPVTLFAVGEPVFRSVGMLTKFIKRLFLTAAITLPGYHT